MIVSKIQESCNTFVPNKSFCQLLEILPTNFVFLKTFNSEFSYSKVYFKSLATKHNPSY